MRRLKPVVMLAALLTLAPMLAGCESFDMDKLDVFGLNEKKKLPGDRKPVFPEGVPGVAQGIPPEYRMGAHQQVDTSLTPTAAEQAAAAEAANAPKTAAVAPAAEPAPKAAPKPRRPKPAAASQPTRVTVQPPTAPAQPAPQAAQQQQQAPWPEPQQQQPAQQPQQQSPWPSPNQSANTAPWPSAPPPGTFTRQ